MDDSSGVKITRFVTSDELRADLAELRLELIKWMIGTAITIAGIVATVFAALTRLFGGS